MTGSLILPPALALIAAGMLLPLLTGRRRVALVLLAPLVSLALVWLVPVGAVLSITVTVWVQVALLPDASST